MSKPVAPVSWATDATVTSGPETGQTTRLDPGAAATQGAIAETSAPARWFNFILGRLGDWTAYLDNLPAETDFTNEDFVWGGTHTFNDVADFTVAPTFPAGFNAAGFVADPGDIGLGGPTNEVLYTTSLGVADPRARVVMVPMADGATASFDCQLLSGTALGWFFTGSGGTISFPLRVPRGGIITRIRAGYNNISGGTAAVEARLWGWIPDKTAAVGVAGGGSFLLGGTAAPGAGVPVIYDLVTTPITVDNSITEYELRFTADAGVLRWVELTYDDPGPRNG